MNKTDDQLKALFLEVDQATQYLRAAQDLLETYSDAHYFIQGSASSFSPFDGPKLKNDLNKAYEAAWAVRHELATQYGVAALDGLHTDKAAEKV